MRRILSTLSALMVLALAVAAVARADVETAPIEYKEGNTRLIGFLAVPKGGQATRPGVLVVPEWWGLNDYAKSRAKQLAELGYTALAVDIYGDGKTTTDPKEAGAMMKTYKDDRTLLRARVKAGLDALKAQPQVDAKRLAAIGYCFGGMTVLELARGGADVAGVVSFHGVLDTPNPADAKNIKGKVLVLHGAEDPFVPPEQVTAFESEMDQAGVDWQLVMYGGVVHTFTNPQADKLNMKGVAYNADADRRSWAAMRQFFDEIFAK